jgi:2,4-dienoyl-CoA reductase-like NADH-dependent reductase (Old Yellow Enzyme family)
MKDSNRPVTFNYLAQELGKRKIAFLCAREYQAGDSIGANLKKTFGGVYIANEKFTRQTAEVAIREGTADAVAFGMKYISNPDLVRRFYENLPLNETDLNTLYASGAQGYTDYPFHA